MNIFEIILFITENIVIIALLSFKIKYTEYNPITDLKRLYNFLTWFYNTGSLSVASKVLGEEEVRNILKSKDKYLYLQTPIKNSRVRLYLPYTKDISKMEMEKMAIIVKNIYELYSQKIDIFSVIITSILLFPSLLALSLTIIISYYVIFFVPLIQLFLLYSVMVKMKWMKRN